MADSDSTNVPKPQVYDLLSRLNAAFARVHRNMIALEQVGIFDPLIVQTLYKSQFAQIVEEYKGKGIPVGYLDKMAEFNRVPSANPMMNELQQFKDLAFRVDAYDNVIVLPRE